MDYQLYWHWYKIDENKLEDMNLGAALLMNPVSEIKQELAKMIEDQPLIEKCNLLYHKNYFFETYMDTATNKHKYSNLILFKNYNTDTDIWRRNIGIIENRCCLTYPNDRYKSVLFHSHLLESGLFLDYPRTKITFENDSLHYFWKIVNKCNLCCCVNKILWMGVPPGVVESVLMLIRTSQTLLLIVLQ